MPIPHVALNTLNTKTLPTCASKRKPDRAGACACVRMCVYVCVCMCMRVCERRPSSPWAVYTLKP